MTTELVLLLCVFAFVTGPLFFRENGPIKVYEKSAPRLGARLEKELATGRGFKGLGNAPVKWLPPNQAPPDGSW